MLSNGTYLLLYLIHMNYLMVELGRRPGLEGLTEYIYIIFYIITI